MLYTFDNREDDLKARFVKTSEHGAKVSVQITFENMVDIVNEAVEAGETEKVNEVGRAKKVEKAKRVFASIKVKKTDLNKMNSDDEKIKKRTYDIFKEELSDMDINFTDDDIEVTVKKAYETLINEVACEDSDRVNILTVLQGLYDKADSNPSTEVLLVKQDEKENKTYLEIPVTQVQNQIADYGWQALEFKKQLRNMGLLVIGKGRNYDFKVYNPRVDKNKHEVWVLRINWKKVKKEFIGSVEGGNAA